MQPGFDTLHHVRVVGDGPATMIFAHGFGCDQSMWQRFAPAYEGRFRTVLFDLAGGAGRDAAAAYDPRRYATLEGHADDLIAVAEEHRVGGGPAIFVGHSVSAMIGVIAHLKRPELFAAHVMVAPSPCYINDGDYVGGFTRADIAALLDALDTNYLGWASQMAPVIMGVPGRPDLGAELAASFARVNPDIARHFARVTFLSDTRAEVARLRAPTLIIQSSDDVIAPRAVGDYLHRTLSRSTLAVIDNVGHCPHVSAPQACAEALDAFLRTL